jgi:hypothetical protein
MAILPRVVLDDPRRRHGTEVVRVCVRASITITSAPGPFRHQALLEYVDVTDTIVVVALASEVDGGQRRSTKMVSRFRGGNSSASGRSSTVPYVRSRNGVPRTRWTCVGGAPSGVVECDRRATGAD